MPLKTSGLGIHSFVCPDSFVPGVSPEDAMRETRAAGRGRKSPSAGGLVRLSSRCFQKFPKKPEVRRTQSAGPLTAEPRGSPPGDHEPKSAHSRHIAAQRLRGQLTRLS